MQDVGLMAGAALTVRLFVVAVLELQVGVIACPLWVATDSVVPLAGLAVMLLLAKPAKATSSVEPSLYVRVTLPAL